MKVAIIGYAKDGKASAKYWEHCGASVEIRDANPEIDAEIPTHYSRRLGDSYLENLDEFDIISRSPSVHPQKIIEANGDNAKIIQKITTDTNEFVRVCPTKNIIGVTGTKGKGTTCTLIQKILESAGKTTHFGGNIGIPMLSLLPNIQKDDWVVIELSSFQLYDFRANIPVAVCLSVTEEHLNWHEDLADYHTAKGNLFKPQTADDIAIYNHKSAVASKLAAQSPAREKLPYDIPPVNQPPETTDGAYVKNETIFYKNQEVISVSDVAVFGRHNLENVCAAIAATWSAIDGDISAINNVLRTWTGLKEHLELIREIDGIKYYNDTYSAATDATFAAMDALPEPKVMILGGIDKGVDLEPMVIKTTQSNVRGVVLIDDLAPRLAELFDKHDFKNAVLGGDTMTEIVNKAKALAKPGDTVLLSPGAAGNGGLFLDKHDRGHQFNEAVAHL